MFTTFMVMIQCLEVFQTHCSQRLFEWLQVIVVQLAAGGMFPGGISIQGEGGKKIKVEVYSVAIMRKFSIFFSDT